MGPDCRTARFIGAVVSRCFGRSAISVTQAWNKAGKMECLQPESSDNIFELFGKANMYDCELKTAERFVFPKYAPVPGYCLG